MTTYLIICPVFDNEVNAVLRPDAPVVIHKMDESIHNKPETMKQELLNGVSAGRKMNADIRFLVGSACECAQNIGEIASACNAKYPSEKNCIEMFVGEKQARELERNRTMLITPGWIRMIKKAIQNEQWSAVDARMNMGRYDRILLLDLKLAPLTDEEILEFYDLVQVPIETQEINLDYFTGVLNRLLG